jgi:hypothetical protein
MHKNNNNIKAERWQGKIDQKPVEIDRTGIAFCSDIHKSMRQDFGGKKRI